VEVAKRAEADATDRTRPVASQRNVKRWKDESMTRRWVALGIAEAKKGPLASLRLGCSRESITGSAQDSVELVVDGLR
jgi:hypothetical protein